MILGRYARHNTVTPAEHLTIPKTSVAEGFSVRDIAVLPGDIDAPLLVL